jgi:hypothetical protein
MMKAERSCGVKKKTASGRIKSASEETKKTNGQVDKPD